MESFLWVCFSVGFNVNGKMTNLTRRREEAFDNCHNLRQENGVQFWTELNTNQLIYCATYL